MKRHLISLSALVLSLMLSTPAYADAAQSKYFTDMNSQSYGFWAIDEVDALFEARVANGIGGNKFAPEMLMERGDFILLLDNAFNYPAINVNMYNFSDVSAEDYYFTAITNARGNGIIDNSPIVYPEQPIKRIDAFKMLYNTMNMYGCVGSNGTTDVSMYTDGNLLLNTTDRIVAGTLTKMGIVSGSNGQLKPNDTVTRAEMAVMLYKAVEIYQAAGSPSVNTGTTQQGGNQDTATESTTEDTQSTEKITEKVAAEAGETVEINGNEINVSGSDAASADGSDSVLKITGSKITAASAETNGVSATNGGKAELNNVNISAGEGNSKGIYVDGSSSATVTGSTVFARGTGSTAVESAGDLVVNDSTLQSVTADAVTIHGGSNAEITGSDIVFEGNSSGIKVTNKDKNYDQTVIDLTDVTFKGSDKGSAITVENSNVVINFKNVILDGLSDIINTVYNYSGGMREATIDLNLDGQTLEGNISGDEKAIINLNLENGSTFKGQLNYTNTIYSMNVELSGDSKLELTGDCYVDAFIVTDERIANDRNFGEIVTDKGKNIYYNADNNLNDYLNDGTYSLLNGGVLTPISGTGEN